MENFLRLWMFAYLWTNVTSNEFSLYSVSCQPTYINISGTTLSSPSSYYRNSSMDSVAYKGNNTAEQICDYYVTAPPGQLVAFLLHEQVEIGCSPLLIFDGESAQDTLLTGNCSDQTSNVVFSSSRYMSLRYRSNGGNENIGFRGQVFFVPDNCSFTYTETGEITSPNFPFNYSNLERCEYTIIAPTNSYISITFVQFSLEDSVDCVKDAIAIIHWSYGQRRTFRVCGSLKRETFYSKGNKMVLEMTTDTERTSFGFNASIAFHSDICTQYIQDNGTTIASVNFPSNYGNFQNCEYFIASGLGQIIELRFESFEVEFDDDCALDSVSIFDGVDERYPLLARLCGYLIPSSIKSSQFYMFIKFTTNDIVTSGGFNASITFIKGSCSFCSVKDHYYGDCPSDGPGPDPYTQFLLQTFPPKDFLQCRASFGNLPSKFYHGVHYWMISMCPGNAEATLRRKCETEYKMDEKSGGILFEPPVVTYTGVIYRNRHCALCNNRSIFEDLKVYTKCEACLYKHSYESGRRMETEKEGCFQFADCSIARKCDPYKTDKVVDCPKPCTGITRTPFFGLPELFNSIKTALQGNGKANCAGDNFSQGRICRNISSVCRKSDSVRYILLMKLNKTSYHCSHLKERSIRCFFDFLNQYRKVALVSGKRNSSEGPDFSTQWNEIEGLEWLTQIVEENIEETISLEVPDKVTTADDWEDHLISVVELVFNRDITNDTCYVSGVDLIQMCTPNGKSESSLECQGVIKEFHADEIDDSVFLTDTVENYWITVKTPLNKQESGLRKKVFFCNFLAVTDERGGLLWKSTSCAVSVICLLLTFIIYAFIPTLRNTFGVIVMMFVVSLATGIICLEFVGHIAKNSPVLCLFVAIITHWIWLSVFGWMAVLAYDLRLTFSSKNMRMTASVNRKRLFSYSIIGVGMPTVVTGAGVICWGSSAVSVVYGSINDRACWIYGGIFALVVVSGPLLVAVTVNVVFFVLIVKNIMEHKRRSKNANLRSTLDKARFVELIVCIKISVLMGFTWLSGYLAPLTGVDEFESIFYLSLLLQSILIFAFFGANQRTRRLGLEKLGISARRTEASIVSSNTNVKDNQSRER